LVPRGAPAAEARERVQRGADSIACVAVRLSDGQIIQKPGAVIHADLADLIPPGRL
jgi:hypothetical protein